MSAYSTTVTPASSSYPALNAPSVSLDFEPDTLILRSEAGNFYLSFDGVNDHIRVQAGDPPLVLQTKRKKMWLRQEDGTAIARVSALTIA
jgi:hypothetical protein